MTVRIVNFAAELRKLDKGKPASVDAGTIAWWARGRIRDLEKALAEYAPDYVGPAQNKAVIELDRMWRLGPS